MLRILHRVNDPAELADTDPSWGVEMDVHAYGDRLVVQHEAFRDGPELAAWLDAYRHRFVVFNVKEEGIESRLLAEVLERGIENFFLLDLSFPALVGLARSGERRVAIRVSVHEPATGALSLAGKVGWVWLDMFSPAPLDATSHRALQDAGFKICLVSPELHGRDVVEITALRKYLDSMKLSVDAVCTKHPDLW